METAYRVVYREDQLEGFAFIVYSILSNLTVLMSYPIVYHVDFILSVHEIKSKT